MRRWLLVGVLLLGATCQAARVPAWQGVGLGSFVTAFARDTAGGVWVGTEDQGVWRAQAGAWRQYTTHDGLGDDNGYALCCDTSGRVWVGHLNHGVSVFDGQTWRNYAPPAGPLGERIRDLEATPDGDVWMATSAGLTRYQSQSDRWTDYTAADGLPSSQVTAVAFDPPHTLYVGTACDGLAVGTISAAGIAWRGVPGPTERPLRAAAEGVASLPSALVNDVSVAPDGAVVVATAYGLARSEDEGRTWRWWRGHNWQAFVEGLADGPPPGFKPDGAGLLSEDYCTFAQDDGVWLWVGHRSTGLEVLDRTGKLVWQAKQPSCDYATAMLPQPGAAPLLGWYGGGLSEAETGTIEGQAPAGTKAPEPGRWPAPPAPPDAAERRRLRARLAALSQPLAPGGAAFLGEDWQTQGSWLGRYGRARGVLCAHTYGNFNTGNCPNASISAAIGRHHRDKDSMRYWVHWLRRDDRRVTYNPVLGYRRQAEWVDNGQAYPLDWAGPDLWLDVRVPAGTHRLALYFFNKDGHDGGNRLRDYLLEVKADGADEKLLDAAPDLAHSRVRDFWGGMYSQFALAGPARFRVRVARNGSLNAILHAAHIDRMTGSLLPTEGSRSLWLPIDFGPYDADWPHLQRAEDVLPAWLDGLATADLWQAANQARGCAGGAALDRAARMALLRAMIADGAPAPVVDRVRWSLPLWAAGDDLAFERAMAEGFARLNIGQ